MLLLFQQTLKKKSGTIRSIIFNSMIQLMERISEYNMAHAFQAVSNWPQHYFYN